MKTKTTPIRAILLLFAASVSTTLAVTTEEFFNHPMLVDHDSIVWSQGLEDSADKLKNMTDAEILDQVPKGPANLTKTEDPATLSPIADGRDWFYNQARNQYRYKDNDGNYGPWLPDDEAYPIAGYTTVKLPTSESVPTQNPATIDIPYSIIPERPGREQYYHSALDYFKGGWLWGRMEDCAKMYFLLKDSDEDSDRVRAEEYAHAAAVACYGYAQAFPRYPLTRNYGKGFVTDPPTWPDYRWQGQWDETRIGRRADGEAHGVGGVAKIVDYIIESDAIRNYSDSVNGAQGNILQFLWDGAIQPGRDRYEQFTGGWTKWGQTWPGSNHRTLALAFNDLDRLRKIVQTYEKIPFNSAYTADGLYAEGMGYAGIQLDKMREGLRTRDGYTDPSDYVINPNGILEESLAPHGPDHNGQSRYDDFLLLQPGPYETFFKKTITNMQALSTPDGAMMHWGDHSRNYFGDNWWMHPEPRERSRNINFYGHKVVKLGDGVGDQQVQVQIIFGPSDSHGHNDKLDMQIWAHGHHLLNDYNREPHTELTGWAASTKAHNTVSINRGSHDRRLDGDPLIYEPRLPGMSIIRAGAPRALNDADEFDDDPHNFSRTVMLNTVDINRPYIVEIFRVKGNSSKDQTRDYMLRGSSFHRENLTLTDTAGNPLATSPDDTGYEHFDRAEKAPAANDFIIDYETKVPWPDESNLPNGWTYPELTGDTANFPDNYIIPYRATPNSWDDKPAVGRRQYVIGQPGMEVYKCDLPWLERIANDAPIEDFINGERIPNTMIRHQTTADDESLFIVVHELWAGTPSMTGVQKIAGAPDGLVALEITFPDRTDRVFISLDDQVHSFTTGDTTFNGRVGLIAEANSGERDAYLIGGTQLTDASASVNLTQPVDTYAGTISASLTTWLGASEPGFVVPANADIPTGDALKGAWMFLHHGPNEDGGGYCFEIDRVETAGGTTTIYTAEEHGLKIDADYYEEFHLPHRKLTGPTDYWIYPAKSNQGTVSVTPAGGAFLDPVDVVCSTPAVGGQVEFSIDSGQNWTTYTGSFRLGTDTTLLVRSVDSDGIKISLPEEYRFSFAHPAATVNSSNFTSGLLRSQTDGLGGDILSQELVPTFINGETEGYFTSTGYLNVPADGVYTFHYRPNRDGRLVIDGKMILDFEWERLKEGIKPNRHTVFARTVDVALRQGLHELELVHAAPGDDGVGFEWESAFMPRRAIVESDLMTDLSPFVEVAAPVDGSTQPAGDINLNADVSDIDGSVTQVEFFVDGESIGVDNTGPTFDIVWTGATAGAHSVSFIATDDLGNTTTSSTVTVFVEDISFLFYDDFDNDDIATGGINGGFSVGGSAPDPGSESGTIGSVDAGDGGNWSTAEIKSLNTFAAPSDGFVATFMVEAWETSNRGTPCHLAIKPNNNGIGQGGYDNGAVAGLSLVIENDTSSSVQLGLRASDTDDSGDATSNDYLLETTVTRSELEDGFTVVIVADPTGWSLDIEGLPSFTSASGSWMTHQYTDLFDNDNHIVVRTRDGTSKDARIAFDRISIEENLPRVEALSPADFESGVATDINQLTWADPVGFDASGYTYTVNFYGTDSSYTTPVKSATGDINLLDISDQALTPSTTYYWNVETLPSGTLSYFEFTTNDSDTPPAAPNGLLSGSSSGNVSLDWADNTDNDFVSYTVYRSTTSGSGYTPLVTDLTASAFTDSTITPLTTYYYVVSAFDLDGNESVFSSEVSETPPVDSTPPSAPGYLIVTPSGDRVALDWANNGEGDLASYSVYRTTTSGSGYSQVASGVAVSAYTDNAVTPGTNYYYVVTAVDTNGNESAYSQEREADLTPPAAPAGVGVSASQSTVYLDWNDNGEGDLSGYSVYRSTTSGSGHSLIASGLPASDYVDGTVSNGTTYYYHITAADGFGNESAASSEAAATPEIDTDAPAAPLNVTVTSGNSWISLDWDDNSEFDLEGYTVYRSTTSGSGYVEIASGLGASDFYETGLEADTAYYYVVTAGDMFGNESAASIESSARTYPAPILVENIFGNTDAATGISTAITYTHKVDLNASTPATINGVSFDAGTTGDNPGLNYHLTGATNGISGHNSPADNSSSLEDLMSNFYVGGDPATLTLTGLTPGMTYKFRLYAGGYSGRLFTFSSDNPSFAAAGLDRGQGDSSNCGSFDFTYTLDPGDTAIVISIDPDDSNSYHWYGFSNEVVALEAMAISPANGETSVSVDLTELTWADPSDPDADTFTFNATFCGTDGTFATNVKSVSGDTNTLDISDQVLNEGTTYYWKVETLPAGVTAYFEFTTEEPTGGSGGSGGTVLFRDSFDDGDMGTSVTAGDLNGGFTPESGDNDSGGDPALPYESGGSVVLNSSSNGGFARVIMNGLNAFDVGDGSTPVTWTVDVVSWTNTDDQTDGKLHLSMGPNSNNSSGATYDQNPGEGLYIHFNTALTQYQLMIGDGSSRDVLHSSGITASNFTDGFSFEVTVDDTGWSFDLTGAGGDDVSTSGAWGSHTFDTTFTALSYLNVFQRDQGAQNDSIAVVIDRIEVSGVTGSNAAPVFTVDPIDGGNAVEDALYSGTIAGSATDADAGDSLTYNKVSGPMWLNVAVDGSLSGLPLNADVGPNLFTVEVSDGTDTDTATLIITVTNTNDAPAFSSDPIDGGNATEGAVFSGSIAGSATDADAGDTLTYSKVSGPAWLNVAGDGSLNGTPGSGDVGANAFTVEVTDGTASVTASLNITVTNINDAPVFTADPISGADATEDTLYSGSIAGSATDADAGDTLTYSKVSGPVWLDVAVDGSLSGLPLNGDVGVNTFTVEVTDGTDTASATLNITVTNTNDAPAFIGDPLTGADATVDTAYSDSLDGSASDDDAGDTLTYSKVSGPAWLSVAGDGGLSGTPTAGDVGLNSFGLQVDDGNGGIDTVTLEITVDAAASGADPVLVENIFGNSDAATGISTVITYTHAVDLNATTPATINGVSFDAGPNGDNPALNYNLSGPSNTHSGFSNPADNGSGLEALLSNFFGKGNNGDATLTLTGLTGGETYKLRLYVGGFSGRTFSWNSDNPSFTAVGLDRGQGDNSISGSFDFTYTLEPGDTDIAINLVSDNADHAFHWYGFTNELVNLEAVATAPTNGEMDVATDISQLTWNDPDNPEAPTFTYQATFFGTDSSFTNSVKTASGDINALDISDQTLDSGTTYYWKVETEPFGVTAYFEFTTVSGAQLVQGTIGSIDSNWQTIVLPDTYTSMVVVATPVITSGSDAPVVPRVRNAVGNSFELKVQNPSGTAVSGVSVHYTVVEEGVYTAAEDGVVMEALKVVSTGTSAKNNWGSVGQEQIIPANSYTSPVVLGQVMSANDAAWSTFWSSNGDPSTPASATAIYIGKHVGEDSVQTRADETLGVIIIEAGSGTLDGVNYSAGVGADSVNGVENSPPYSYSVSGLSSASSAILSQAAMDGGDGSWAVLYGTTPLSPTTLNLAVDEDRLADSERRHTTEQIGYLIFE